MTIGFVFWLLMLITLVFGIWSAYPFTNGGWKPLGSGLLLYILLFLLGWGVFGFPIRG